MADSGFSSSDRRRHTENRATMATDDLTQASDAVLVMAISRWNEPALAEVYHRHASAVYSLARRVTGDRATAEEIVQEVFLKLWNAPERFDPDRGRLRTFLLAQTHGRSVDRVRSEVARHRRESDDARQELRRPRPRTLDEEVVELITSERVRDAVRSLPDDERAAIELAYFGGRSYREVAAELDAPEGTVKSRIRSGMGRLRRSLGDEMRLEEVEHDA